MHCNLDFTGGVLSVLTLSLSQPSMLLTRVHPLFTVLAEMMIIIMITTTSRRKNTMMTMMMIVVLVEALPIAIMATIHFNSRMTIMMMWIIGMMG